jgi:streptogramin lyase
MAAMTSSKLQTTTALLAAATIAALAPGSAAAAPAVDGEFPVSKTPGQLTLGPDGNIWVTIGNDIAKITPDGTVTEYDPADVTGPVGITTGPDGNIWVSQSDGVAKVPPAAPLTATKFTIAEILGPRAIATGPDGNLWTASGDKVIKIPPADPASHTAYTVAGLGARGIASGGDGQLWVADFAEQRVVSITTGGVSTPYPVGSSVQEVAAGPGTQIAYSSPSGDPQHIGRISPGGQPQKSPAPGADPFGITFGPDGAYWFAEFAGNKVGRMTTGGDVTELDGLSPGSGPRFIAAGPGNTLWVSLETSKKVARITGVVAPPPALPSPPAGPSGDSLAPTIQGLALSPEAFRVGRRAKLRYRLSEDASVRLVIRRVRSRKRHSHRAGTLTRTGVQGRNVVRFSGRIGRRPLRPGRYRLIATARDGAGNVSRPKRATFRIKR